MNEGKIYDVIIIGAGPIGLSCGIKAQKENLEYLIIEKGCLVNSLYNYPVHMTFFSTPEKLEIGNIPFVSNNPKPNRLEAIEYYRRVAQTYSLKINLFEKVNQINNNNTFFEITTPKATYNTKNIIISTGFYDIPILLNIPGEDLPKVSHYYRDPHFYASTNVLVVGANNSAVDAALETYRKGANVTMVIKGESIGERVKYWVRPDIINRISEGVIKAYYHSELTSITEKDVTISQNVGSTPIHCTIPNDFVLAMTGYRPDTAFLASLGINLSQDGRLAPDYNPETMETNVKGIYLAGVVIGGLETHKWFIENSREHANTIITLICNKKTNLAH